MLAKLIRHDLKSLSHFLILFHVILLVTALLLRVFLTGGVLSAAWMEPIEGAGSVRLLAALVIFFIVASAVYFGTQIIIVVRFYRNLFSSEGYLTHTLPVTRAQHLMAKTISGSLWSIADMLLLLLAGYIAFITPAAAEFLHAGMNHPEVRAVLGFTGRYADLTWGYVGGVFLLTMLIGAVSNTVINYCAVILGQLFPGHRVLAAVGMYFIINLGVSVISMLSMVLLGLMSSDALADRLNGSYPIGYILSTFRLSIILCVSTTVILYLANWLIMERRVNLD